MVLLSVQPCEDVLAQVDGQGHQSYSAAQIEQSSDDADGDDCSPFCICSCCSMPVASRHYGLSVPKTEQTISSRATAVIYKDPYQSNPLSSIWQPPKA